MAGRGRRPHPLLAERARGAQLQAVVRLRRRLPRRRRARPPGGPAGGRPSVLRPRGPQQRLGLGPADLHPRGPLRAGRSGSSSWPTATGPCSGSCPTPPSRTSSPSATRSTATPTGRCFALARARRYWLDCAATPAPSTPAGSPSVPRGWRSAWATRRRRTAASTAGTASTVVPTATSTTRPTRSTQLRRAGTIEYRPGLHVERMLEREDGVTVQASAIGGGPGETFTRRARDAGRRSDLDDRHPAALRPAAGALRDPRQPDLVPAVRVARAGRGHRARTRPHALAGRARARRPGRLRQARARLAVHPQRRDDASAPVANTRGSARCSVPRSTPSPGAWWWGSASFTATTPTPWPAAGTSDADRSPLTPCSTPPAPRRSRRFQRALRALAGPSGLVPLAPLAADCTPRRRLPLRRLGPDARSSRGSGSPTRSDGPAARGASTSSTPACFPSVPGGSITLTAMANAHRIAAAAATGTEPAAAGEPA